MYRATNVTPGNKPPKIVDVGAWRICVAESVKRGTGGTEGTVHKRDPPVFLECCPGSCQLLPFIKLLQVSVLAEQLGDILRGVRCRSSSPAHASNLERILLALSF